MISLQHTVAKTPPFTNKYTSSFIQNYNMIVVFFPGFDRFIPGFDRLIPGFDRFIPASVPVTGTPPTIQMHISQ